MKNIFNYFLDNKLVVNMVVLVVFLVGVYAMLQLRQEEMPPSDMDMMMITVIYPGTSPQDVELNAVEPIERVLSEISGIEKYTSLSIENQASITVELDADLSDTRPIKDEIYRKITKSNIRELPNEVENILVVDKNPKRKAVYSIVIYPKDSSSATESDLHIYAKQLADDLLKVEGVSEVRKWGWREREIHINVDPRKASKLNIPLSQITKSIQARNIRQTGGTLQSLTDEKTIVTIGQFEEPLDVGEVIVRSNFTGQRVKIKDIAEIRDSFKRETTRIMVNGQKGVILEIVKEEDADIVETVDNAKAYLLGIYGPISSKFNIDLVEDSTLSIISLLNVVKSNAILGFILVVIILLIFMDHRTAFWTAFGLPVSLSIVFIYMFFADLSLNRITLIALITVLGMLVDDGIVIAEMIYSLKQKGLSSIEAARQGVAAVIAPVSVSIFTTIVAFLPMLTIGGMMGKFIYYFPIVVTAMLIASLIEATFILPNHLAHSKFPQKKKDWFAPVKNIYGKFLKLMLKLRYVVVIIFIGLFVLAIGLSKETIRNFQLMPSMASNIIRIDLESATGTSLDKMSEYTTEIEKIAREMIPEDAFVSTKSSIGKHESKFFSSKGNYKHWSTITVNLVPVNERELVANDIVSMLKKEINPKKFKHFTSIKIMEAKHGPPTGEAIDIKIIGDNNVESMRLADTLQVFLKGIDGVFNVQDDVFEGKAEMKVTFKYTELARLGLTVQDVAQTVRTAYDGMIATSTETGDELLDFRVKVDDSYQKDQQYLLSLKIPNNQNRLIRLSDVAYIVERQSFANIDHYDGERAISVNAKVHADKITSAQANIDVQNYFDTIKDDFPNTNIIAEGEAKATKETLGDVFYAYGLAILLIFFVLILLFKSISQPLLVIAVVPFGIIGALVAFTLHGMPLSFMGVIGIIGLSGVVVNDSVIMIDLINNIFKQNKDGKVIENIVEGARERLRPVLLTTITTVAGLLPTVYGFLGESDMIAPVAMAMAYGLIFATTLTLLFIPSLYMVNKDIVNLFSFGKKRGKK